MTDKVQAVVDAYQVEGINPRYHRWAKKQLHKQWPALDNALDALAEDH